MIKFIKSFLLLAFIVWGSEPLIAGCCDWKRMDDFQGGVRRQAVGISIGPYGYLGTGFGNLTYHDDWWQFDPATNSWTQMADFAGTPREGAVGFSIDTLGFVGTGYDTTSQTTNDFYRYNATTNTWDTIAPLPGPPRIHAVGMRILDKGYVGTGAKHILSNDTLFQDWWQYNPVTDAWSARQDFNGRPRKRAAGFSLKGKGYLGTGIDTAGLQHNTFYKYDPIFDNWSFQGWFNGTTRYDAVGFAIDTIGFLGLGDDGTFRRDMWKYIPSKNKWIRICNLEGPPRIGAAGFSMNNKAYVMTGQAPNPSPPPSVVRLQDNWELTLNQPHCSPPCCQWSETTFLGGTARSGASSFTIDSIGYVGLGLKGNTSFKDFWAYNPITDTWTQKANFQGSKRHGAASFVVNGKGYITTGRDTSGVFQDTLFKDTWQYDPVANSWSQRQNFPGGSRVQAVGFGLQGKGYVGTGRDSAFRTYNDFWAYDPGSNSWTSAASFPGQPRYHAMSFTIDSIGYVGLGADTLGSTLLAEMFRDFYAYLPDSDKWVRKADYRGVASAAGVSFGMQGKGYMGGGVTSYFLIFANFTDQFYEYHPSADQWVPACSFLNNARTEAVVFNFDTVTYIGTGYSFMEDSVTKDFWKFEREYMSPANPPTGDTIVCKYDSAIQYQTTPVAGATFYEWWVPPSASILNGQGTTTIFVRFDSIGGKVCVRAGNVCNVSAFKCLEVKAINPSSPPTAVNITQDTICRGDSTTISVISNATNLYGKWAWYTDGCGSTFVSNDSSITVTPDSSTTYSVRIEDTCGATSCVNQRVYVVQKPLLTTSIAGTDTLCQQQTNVTFQVNATPNTTGYDWQVPNDATITSGQGTDSITVQWGDSSGTVCTTPYNSCHRGDTTCKKILVTPPLMLSKIIDPVRCNQDSSGEISLGISGGQMPYDIQWSTGDSAPIVSGLPTGTYQVTVTEAANCYTLQDTFNINIEPMNVQAIPDTTICMGDKIQLTGSGGNTYRWSPAYNLSDTTSASPTANPLTDTSYRLIATEGICSDTDWVMIGVNPLPNITAQPDTTIWQGDTIKLYAQGGQQYNWQPTDYLSNASSAEPAAYPDRETAFIVTGADSIGCSQQDTIIVDVRLPIVSIPNTITPNGDGINDRWIITKAKEDGQLNVTIYNRWGQEVFQQDNYDNTWKGTNQNGKQLPIGTYYYIVEVENWFEPYTGNITILR